MNKLYATKVTAVGGRSGTVRSEDGLLDLTLALPSGLGGKGGATNPEQLFAAGYAACFENAVIHVTRNKAAKVKDDDITVVAEVGMSPNGNGGSRCRSRWMSRSPGSTRRPPRISCRPLMRCAPIPMP